MKQDYSLSSYLHTSNSSDPIAVLPLSCREIASRLFLAERTRKSIKHQRVLNRLSHIAHNITKESLPSDQIIG